MNLPKDLLVDLGEHEVDGITVRVQMLSDPFDTKRVIVARNEENKIICSAEFTSDDIFDDHQESGRNFINDVAIPALLGEVRKTLNQ